MKVGYFAAAAWWVAVVASAIHPGDSMEAVIEELGRPASYLQAGHRTVYHYDRGRVEFTNDVVASVELEAPIEVVAGRWEERRREARRVAEEAAAERQRRREGLALRSRTVRDPAFQAASAAEQAAFWRRFAAAYPSVSVEAELARALRRSETAAREVRRARERAALDQVERRLWDIERRALEAEVEAVRARAEAARAQALAMEAGRQARAGASQAERPNEEEFIFYYSFPGHLPDRPSAGPPPEPKAADWGRYATERRLGPIGRPVFGGRGLSSAAP